MMRRSLFVLLLLTVGCRPIAYFQRQSYFAGFVGRPASNVLSEFGKPDDSMATDRTAHLTYYVPLGNGTARKVVFTIDPSDTVTHVNYWPKY